MTTIVLTWNPDRMFDWPDADVAKYAHATARGRTVTFNWSVGKRRHGVNAGDRCFMLRQGRIRGIVASGTLDSDLYMCPHWDASRTDEAPFVDVCWDTVLTQPDMLTYADLLTEPTGFAWNRVYGSGRTLPPSTAAAVEILWTKHLKSVGRAQLTNT